MLYVVRLFVDSFFVVFRLVWCGCQCCSLCLFWMLVCVAFFDHCYCFFETLPFTCYFTIALLASMVVVWWFWCWFYGCVGLLSFFCLLYFLCVVLFVFSLLLFLVLYLVLLSLFTLAIHHFWSIFCFFDATRALHELFLSLPPPPSFFLLHV